jgi:Na+:H+ antiporter, NhaA family
VWFNARVQKAFTRLWPGPHRQYVHERLIRSVVRFVHTEASGGIVLLAATVIAIAWANSPWQERYFDLWDARLTADLNLFRIDESLRQAVNDGLMAIFFFVAGLEIKRELLAGELASRRQAALPIAAALGGMVVPALIYAAANAGGAGANGWGIPMATDIAFAMGVMALLGRRVPLSLKVFLLGLAIVDDLGAILVIAVFYTGNITLEALAWAAGLAVLIFALARAGVRSTALYVTLGVLFWLAVFESGVHATLAGVVLAILTPLKPRFTQQAFATDADDLLASYRAARDLGDNERAQQVLKEFESLSRGTESPLRRLEEALHPWVSYGVIPIFALANAGVALSADLVSDSLTSPVSLGIVLGLVVGKPAGIVLACFLTTRVGLAELPANTGLGHILGAGLVAGIGFTVSLFVSGLAFDSAVLGAEAKVGILAASVVAGMAGFAYLWLAFGEPGESTRSTGAQAK